jgi:hypothetical protein
MCNTMYPSEVFYSGLYFMRYWSIQRIDKINLINTVVEFFLPPLSPSSKKQVQRNAVVELLH